MTPDELLEYFEPWETKPPRKWESLPLARELGLRVRALHGIAFQGKEKFLGGSPGRIWAYKGEVWISTEEDDSSLFHEMCHWILARYLPDRDVMAVNWDCDPDYIDEGKCCAIQWALTLLREGPQAAYETAESLNFEEAWGTPRSNFLFYREVFQKLGIPEPFQLAPEEEEERLQAFCALWGVPADRKWALHK